jgi:hypothetical protein
MKNISAEFIINHDADEFSRNLDFNPRVGNSDEFNQELVVKLLNYNEPLDRLVFLYRIDYNLSNELEKHLQICEHKDTPMSCDKNVFYFKSKFYVEQEIKKLNPAFQYSILRPSVNSILINQNLANLNDYPKASMQYLKAIDKLNQGKLERNLLDDLRLSLECLMKEMFQNEKSLENQFQEVMKFLKERDTSNEISNMFRLILDYYSKYQNNYVKHNERIRKDEVDLLVNLTSAFVSFLINK